MRRILTTIAIPVLVAAMTTVALAQEAQRTEEPERRGARVGQMIVPPGAFLRVNEQSQAIWERVVQIQNEMNQGVWQLSLLHAQRADEDAIQAHVNQMRERNQQMQQLREALRPHIVFPEGMFQGGQDGGGAQGEGRGGGQGGGAR